MEASGKPASKKLQDVEWVDLGSPIKDFEGFVASKMGGYVTKFAPHIALKLIA